MSDEWQERLRRASAESLRRRAARSEARREMAERRRHGVAARLAWRQLRRDARATDHPAGHPPAAAGPAR